MDGFYYAGVVSRCLNPRYVEVDFRDFDRQVVSSRYVITMQGARPCPSLKVQKSQGLLIILYFNFALIHGCQLVNRARAGGGKSGKSWTMTIDVHDTKLSLPIGGRRF